MDWKKQDLTHFHKKIVDTFLRGATYLGKLPREILDVLILYTYADTYGHDYYLAEKQLGGLFVCWDGITINTTEKELRKCNPQNSGKYFLDIVLEQYLFGSSPLGRFNINKHVFLHFRHAGVNPVIGLEVPVAGIIGAHWMTTDMLRTLVALAAIVDK